MADTAQRIRALLDAFVSEVTSIVMADVVQAMTNLRPQLAHAPSASARPSALTSGKGRRRRGTGQLRALEGRLLSFIEASPGQRMDQIRIELGTTAAKLARPIRALIAAKQIRTTGQRRGTVYHPVSAPAAPAAAAEHPKRSKAATATPGAKTAKASPQRGKGRAKRTARKPAARKSARKPAARKPRAPKRAAPKREANRPAAAKPTNTTAPTTTTPDTAAKADGSPS